VTVYVFKGDINQELNTGMLSTDFHQEGLMVYLKHGT